MCYNDKFIRYYDTLWHYCTLLFFLLFFLLWHMGLLFFLLWHIIFHYFFYYFLLWQGVGTRKMGMCRQQFLTQSWRNDWLVSMKNACSSASASTGRRADRMDSGLMERSGTIIRIIFSIKRIICLGWTGLPIAVAVITSYALQMYVQRFCALLQA